MVVVVTGDACELQGAFTHTERGIAVAVHDTIRKGAMICPDAHRAAEILAQMDERDELLADFL